MRIRSILLIKSAISMDYYAVKCLIYIYIVFIIV